MKPELRLTMLVAATMAAAFGSALTAAGHALPTGEPFAIESTASVPFGDATAISIVGIRGYLSISTGEQRELQLSSRALGPNRVDSPLGIWREDSRLVVAPPPGDSGGARRVEVKVPKGVAIAVDAAYTDLAILAQGGIVELRGDNLRATVQVVGGSLVADLLAGTLTVRDSKDANARLRGTVTAISAMSGNVTVRTEGGKLSVAAVQGSIDVESEGSKMGFENLSGSLRVTAEGGEATVVGFQAGAEFTLVGTPLRLKDGMGEITVTSDAAVVFQTMEGSMQLDMRGGSLSGKGHTGDLFFSGRDMEASVASITGVTSVKGDRLTARVVDVGGELQIDATASSFIVDRAGDVVVNVDSGSVSVQHAAGSVKAKVTGGNVHILEGMGPVSLEMDGGDGEVSWATISGGTDSTLANAGGTLAVLFSASGGCRVEAKSTYGRVDNELENVKVSEDLSSARGPVGSGEGPWVRISASGDVRLANAEKPR